ncbi:MAG TPA: hypothetical protein VGB79_03050 [Allosphingosinicella sp.]|jgi:hypothetical protein
MTEPVFTRSGATDLYWSEPAAGRGTAFLATGSTASTLTLTQCWAEAGGVFLVFSTFCADDGADSARAQSLRTMLGWLGWPALGPRLVWIDNDLPPGDALNPFALSARSLDTVGDPSAARLRRPFDLPLGGYWASCGAGATLGLAPDRSGLLVAGGVSLVAPGGVFRAGTDMLIPLGGPVPGSWRFTIPIGPGDFDRLGMGLRFTRPAAIDDGSVDVLHLPLLEPPEGILNLWVCLDPLRPLDPARTRLSFFADTAPIAAPAMLSTFVTARGHEVRLTPSAAGGRPAGLVFATQPIAAGEAGNTPACFYLAPDGHFDVSAGPSDPPRGRTGGDGAIERLVCGSAGLEYLAFPRDPADRSHRLVFLPGRPAHAAPVEPGQPDAPRLTAAGTTSWAYVWTQEGSKAAYYSQPDQAPLFSAPAGAFVPFFEAPVLGLPAEDGLRAFPMAPYRGVAPGAAAELAKALEVSAIAPERQAQIRRLRGADHELLAAEVEDRVAVTPQGLAVGLSNDPTPLWNWLGIAKLTDATGLPDLRFTRIGGAFKRAMQANRLFAVLADADQVMASGSVPYCLTADAVKVLRAAAVPAAILDPVAAALTGIVKNNEPDFVAAILASAPGATAYLPKFLRVSGQLAAAIEDWRFQLSPRNWSNPERVRGKNAYFIVKLTRDRTLRDYVADIGSWTWREAAGADAGVAAAEIEAIIADAEKAWLAAPGADNPYAHFFNEVATDPNWTGILCLRCDVPLTSLPAPLRPLQAGIDANAFFAHHVGFNVTGFKAAGEKLLFDRTSMFGLIDYDDPADLLLEESVDFGFKVLRLAVGFRNSQISYFSSRIELMANRLFAQPARLWPTEHGNNLILDGTYQRQKGKDGTIHGTYLFASNADSVFQIADSALQSVEVMSVRLATEPPAAGKEDEVSGVFQVGGRLRFWDSGGFDPFCYGPVAPHDPPPPPSPPGVSRFAAEAEEEWIETPHGRAKVIAHLPAEDEESQLDSAESKEKHAQSVVAEPTLPDGYLVFSGLGVAMSFNTYHPVPAFRFATERVAFDLAQSVPRENSLTHRFPARLKRLVAVPNLAAPGQPPSGQDPKDLGYASVTATDFDQSLMTAPWFGLEYELALGGLGALAASAALTVPLLAAWGPGGTTAAPAVYFGLKLPGTRGSSSIDLALQGALTLGFRSIEFQTYPAPGPATPVEPGVPPPLAYLIRFRNFGLHALGMSFPPGRNDIYLFGNPDQSSNTTLGWYAAYAGDEDKKKPAKLGHPRLLATRHKALPGGEE